MFHALLSRNLNYIIKQKTIRKMSRSPNTLNLNSYTQEIQQPHPIEDQSPYGQRAEQELESQTIQQQFDNFMKDIQNYNQIINDLAKNVDQANAQQYFITDFYPQFPLNSTYEDDEEKRIVATTDPELAKIMENLERSNRILKQELKGWLFEFSKKTRLSEILITENQILRKRVCSKNKEIVKLIEAINRTENTDLSDLNQNLNELKEENGVLLDHLKIIKESIKTKKIQEKKLIEAYEKAQRDKLEIQSKIAEAEDEEEHYSKQISLMTASIDQLDKREKRLQNEKHRLTKILEDYRRDEENIEKQLQNCNIDREEIQSKLKNKFRGHENQKQRVMKEIEELTEQIQQAQQQTRHYQIQIKKNQTKIEEFKFQENQISRKVADGSKEIEKVKKQLQDVINAETQYLSDIDMINFDMEVMKEELKELQEKQNEEEERHKEEMKRLEQQKKKELESWVQEYQKAQRQSCSRILQQKSELAFKKKQVQDWQRKISDKNSELLDLKSQLKEIKQNQGKVIELRKKLREAKLAQ